VTKGYAAHEKEIFEAVANARSKLLAAQTRDEQIDAAQQETSALGRLLAIAENYPNLKADVQFGRLSDELAGTENRIAADRNRYNDPAQEYNTSVKRLPQALYARFIGFGPQKYFEVSESAKQVPKVDFGTKP